MADQTWGKCKGCRFFESHHPGVVQEATAVAKCTQPELADFDLQVSADSGCNAFEARVGIAPPVQPQQEMLPSIH